MFEARPISVKAFRWQGEVPHDGWPGWLWEVAKEESKRRCTDEEIWPKACVSVCGQNTPSVTLNIIRPNRRGFICAVPGDWIVLLANGRIDTYDVATFRKMYCEKRNANEPAMIDEFSCPECDEPCDPTKGVGPYGVSGTENGVPYNRELGVMMRCKNSHSWEALGKTMLDLITAHPKLGPGYLSVKAKDDALKAVGL